MTQRYKRKDISGAKGWQVNAAGIVYRSKDKQEVTNVLGGLPSIDFQGKYRGTIPSTGLFRHPAKVAPELHPQHRLLEEVVAIAFHGRPGYNWPITKCVGHRDGNDWNCAAANLYWKDLDPFDDDAEIMRTIWLMRRENRSGRGAEARRTISTKVARRYDFVTALNVPALLYPYKQEKVAK
jgi:hypothetical protein